MKKSNVALLLFVMAFCLAPVSRAFSQSSTIPVSAINSMLVADWVRAKTYTQEYMNVMPAEKYDFKPTDSVRSFAQQLLHLASANMFFISLATGHEPPYAGPDWETSTTAQSADSVMYYVNSSYDFAINSIKNLGSASLMLPITYDKGKPFTASRLGWLMKAFEHQTHHRGQCTIYLRLSGIHPPQELLF